MSLDIRADRTAAEQPPLRQNTAGDVVTPLERGEIVALPRLWGFDLTDVDVDGGVLATADGLLARVRFSDSTAVVESVVEPSLPRAVAGR